MFQLTHISSTTITGADPSLVGTHVALCRGDDGVIYLLATTKIYSLNTSTAAVTLVHEPTWASTWTSLNKVTDTHFTVAVEGAQVYRVNRSDVEDLTLATYFTAKNVGGSAELGDQYGSAWDGTTYFSYDGVASKVREYDDPTFGTLDPDSEQVNNADVEYNVAFTVRYTGTVASNTFGNIVKMPNGHWLAAKRSTFQGTGEIVEFDSDWSPLVSHIFPGLLASDASDNGLYGLAVSADGKTLYAVDEEDAKLHVFRVTQLSSPRGGASAVGMLGATG